MGRLTETSVLHAQCRETFCVLASSKSLRTFRSSAARTSSSLPTRPIKYLGLSVTIQGQAESECDSWHFIQEFFPISGCTIPFYDGVAHAKLFVGQFRHERNQKHPLCIGSTHPTSIESFSPTEVESPSWAPLHDAHWLPLSFRRATPNGCGSYAIKMPVVKLKFLGVHRWDMECAETSLQG